MDKFCLDWKDYNLNIKEYCRELRGDPRLFDVTLATDDGKHIQAHKIILSAGSYFFNDIFAKTNHSNMLVYMKGISSVNLEPIIDFIYNGEAFITQDKLDILFETGKELMVKGLDDELTKIGKKENKKDSKHKESRQQTHVKEIGLESRETSKESIPENKVSKNKNESADFEDNEVVGDITGVNHDSKVIDDKIKLHVGTDKELKQQLNGMIEKLTGVWVCKICDKTANTKQNIQYHTETHLKGIAYACYLCSKTFQNRPNLSTHISRNHSALFSCDICGKTGMNRLASKNHKRRHHKTEKIVKVEN